MEIVMRTKTINIPGEVSAAKIRLNQIVWQKSSTFQVFSKNWVKKDFLLLKKSTIIDNKFFFYSKGSHPHSLQHKIISFLRIWNWAKLIYSFRNYLSTSCTRVNQTKIQFFLK